jgi:2-polyprenyl-3-methyl-5-hydroxy-6-metoxy-1,4-benzoquinol methylase
MSWYWAPLLSFVGRPGAHEMQQGSREYAYGNADFSHTHEYLLTHLGRILDAARPQSLFEIGCGNGAVANWFQSRGIRVTGVDSSESGIAWANRAYPDIPLAVGSAYDDLATTYGRFPVVVSLEVVEHLYFPRKFARAVFDLLEPGGLAIISTPYHGYLKNLALALTDRFDAHFGALWDGGHIKFWSERTLRTLLMEAGFQNITFRRAGRVPQFAKSMIATANKPIVGRT